VILMLADGDSYTTIETTVPCYRDYIYERASTLLTSNRPVDDWGKLLGDTAAVTALLDRLLHHAHMLKCGPRSWRTKVQTDLRTEEETK
jgi:IstB-like ATP binding protein